MNIRLLLTMMIIFSSTIALGSHTCTVSTIPLNFGSVNLATNTDTTGTVSVTCTHTSGGSAVSYTVAFGTGGSGNQLARSMTHTVTSSLKEFYNIYTNTGYSVILGNNTGGTVRITNSYSLATGSRTDNHTAFGRVPSQPLAIPGTYTDTIVITVTF